MMNEGYIFSLWVLAAVLTLTTFTELQSARIPNWITLPALVFAFIISFVGVGIPLASSVAGFVIGFGFLFIFYMFGGMGGGDVKLMGTVGALLGFPDILNVLMYTAIFGGAMAVIALIWNKRLVTGLQQSLSMFFTAKKGQTLDDVVVAETPTGEPVENPVTIPYGLAIVLGCLMHVVVQTELIPS